MAHQTAFQRFSDSIVDVVVLRFIPRSVRPNHITAIRFALIPLVVWMILRDYFLLSIIVFIVAAFTDLVDGALARTRDQITEFGKIIDPIADKLLVGSLMIPLVAMYLNILLALTMLLLEVFFLICGFTRKYRGRDIQANWWGKIKFNFQVLGILALLVGVLTGNILLSSISLGLFSIALGFGIVSLLTHGF